MYSVYSVASVVEGEDDDDNSVGGDSVVSGVTNASGVSGVSTSTASRMRYRNMLKSERGVLKNAVRAAREHLIKSAGEMGEGGIEPPTKGVKGVKGGGKRVKNGRSNNNRPPNAQQPRALLQQQQTEGVEMARVDMERLMKRLQTNNHADRQTKAPAADLSRFDNFHGEYVCVCMCVCICA